MCLCDWSPVETLDTESLTSFPGHSSLLEKSGTSWTIPLGEDSQKFMTSFPQTSSYVPFLFANFVLDPFAVINYSCEDYCVLSPESPTSKSLKLSVVLGRVTHNPSYFCSLIPLHSCHCSPSPFCSSSNPRSFLPQGLGIH